MNLKVKVLLLLILVEVVCGVSWTPDKKHPKHKPKKHGCDEHSKTSQVGNHPPPKHNESIPNGPLTCKSLVAYFDNTFKTSYQNRERQLRFQFRLTHKNGNYKGKMEHWDYNLGQWGNISWSFMDSNDFNVNETGVSPSSSYIGNYVGEKYVREGEAVNSIFRFFGPRTSRSGDFELTNTIGQCAKVGPAENGYTNQDDVLFQHCVCCGDIYDPSPDLDCLQSPWVEKKPKHDCDE